MTCIPIEHGILCIVDTVFYCPYCQKEHNDNDEKYLDRCNKNKNFATRVKCSCGEKFIMLYSYDKILTFVTK